MSISTQCFQSWHSFRIDLSIVSVGMLTCFFCSLGSPDDWECFLQYLGCLFEDDSMWKFFDDIDQIHPTKNIECKFSHLTEEMVIIITSSRT